MTQKQWTTHTSNHAANRRAGGRRRHNAKRRRLMWARRFAILKILAMTGEPDRGDQSRLAAHFGVHRSVINRDLVWVRAQGLVGAGVTPRCSYRRRAVTIKVEWANLTPAAIVRGLTSQIDRARGPRIAQPGKRRTKQ